MESVQTDLGYMPPANRVSGIFKTSATDGYPKRFMDWPMAKFWCSMMIDDAALLTDQ
jgi:hypothetical protein